jgi:hypothetical protein
MFRFSYTAAAMQQSSMTLCLVIALNFDVLLCDRIIGVASFEYWRGLYCSLKNWWPSFARHYDLVSETLFSHQHQQLATFEGSVWHSLWLKFNLWSTYVLNHEQCPQHVKKQLQIWGSTYPRDPLAAPWIVYCYEFHFTQF